MNKRSIITTGAALVLATLGVPTGFAVTKIVNRIIARVNNEIITQRQFERKQQDLRAELAQHYSGPELEVQYKEKSSDMLRSILEGIDTRQARITDLNSRMLDARAGLYHALGDRYAVYVEQYGRLQVQPSGQFAYSDRAALARFNATADPINGGLKRIAQLEQEGKELQQYFAQGMQQLVGGQPN